MSSPISTPFLSLNSSLVERRNGELLKTHLIYIRHRQFVHCPLAARTFYNYSFVSPDRPCCHFLMTSSYSAQSRHERSPPFVARSTPANGAHAPTTVSSAPTPRLAGHEHVFKRTITSRAPQAPILYQGYVKKQGARVHLWSSRYALLRGNTLILVRGRKEELEETDLAGSVSDMGAFPYLRSSQALPHAGPPKREFTLLPGSFVSEVRELVGAASKGKSLWEFRLHWPENVQNYGRGRMKGETEWSGRKNASQEGDGEDDYDEYIDGSNRSPRQSPPTTIPAGPTTSPPSATKDAGQDVTNLAAVAGQAAWNAKHIKIRGAQLEKSRQEHQSLVARGATVAGVVVGGVVIGALTAGVGVLPYLGMVGAAAVAGGGAVPSLNITPLSLKIGRAHV